MKIVLLALLSLTFISCASHEARDPASSPEDVSRGVNADQYYGGGFN